MKKMVTMTLVTAISTLLLVGCNTTKGAVAPEDSRSGGYEYPLPAHTDKSKLHDAIIQAGKDKGWIITEFKSNALVAEKICGERSASATIKFNGENLAIVKESVTSCPDSKYEDHVDELQNAIFEILETEASH